MVNTPRGHRGRFVKASTSTEKSHSKNSIKSYFSAIIPLSSSPLSRSQPLSDGLVSRPETVVERVPDSIGRPPTKLSLQSNDKVLEITNDVTKIIDLETTDSKDGPEELAEGKECVSKEEERPIVLSKPKESEKRTLRSKDGSSRITSDLARFFADYDDVVFGPPKEPDILTPDTILYIIDKKAKTQTLPESQIQAKESSDKHHEAEEKNIVQERLRGEAGTLRNDRTHTRFDLSAFSEQAKAYTEDPLADAVYLKPHKRAERKEKQLRNIEKEHALHEKADLERIMDELQGSEWLRAMGITGASDLDKKRYMQHRDHFIARVKVLLSKFTAWKEQEKELRIRKEEIQAAQEDEEEGEDSGPESMDSSVNDRDKLKTQPAPSLVKKITLRLTPVTTPAPEPPKPFTSFYSKAHLREAALAGHRRGRSVTAFGLPLPDIHDQEFTLPDDFISEEAIIANARKRRRLKRESHVEGHER